MVVKTIQIPPDLLSCPSRADVALPEPDADGKYKMSAVDRLILDLTAAGETCANNLAAIKRIVEASNVS